MDNLFYSSFIRYRATKATSIFYSAGVVIFVILPRFSLFRQVRPLLKYIRVLLVSLGDWPGERTANLNNFVLSVISRAINFEIMYVSKLFVHFYIYLLLFKKYKLHVTNLTQFNYIYIFEYKFKTMGASNVLGLTLNYSFRVSFTVSKWSLGDWSYFVPWFFQ